MNKTILALCIVLSLASSSLAASPQRARSGDVPLVWNGRFVPCTLEVCGQFPQNIATLGADKAEIGVNRNGGVRIRLENLTILATGEIAAYKTLEVQFGSFITLAYDFTVLGMIVTDAAGDYNGSIDTGGGVPFAFPPGTTHSGQFVLNEPGVRSEFITGFQIP